MPLFRLLRDLNIECLLLLRIQKEQDKSIKRVLNSFLTKRYEFCVLSRASSKSVYLVVILWRV